MPKKKKNSSQECALGCTLEAQKAEIRGQKVKKPITGKGFLAKV